MWMYYHWCLNYNSHSKTVKLTGFRLNYSAFFIGLIGALHTFMFQFHMHMHISWWNVHSFSTRTSLCFWCHWFSIATEPSNLHIATHAAPDVFIVQIRREREKDGGEVNVKAIEHWVVWFLEITWRTQWITGCSMLQVQSSTEETILKTKPVL